MTCHEVAVAVNVYVSKWIAAQRNLIMIQWIQINVVGYRTSAVESKPPFEFPLMSLVFLNQYYSLIGCLCNRGGKTKPQVRLMTDQWESRKEISNQ